MNIRSIARESGVSTATVSRVLNNSSLVNPETRQKVMEVVEALDFKLRNTARKNFTIGVTVPAISQTQLNHNFVCEFLAGIAQSVSKLQAAIKVIDINDLLLIPDKRGSCNDFCKEMGINAFIHMLALGKQGKLAGLREGEGGKGRHVKIIVENDKRGRICGLARDNLVTWRAEKGFLIGIESLFWLN